VVPGNGVTVPVVVIEARTVAKVFRVVRPERAVVKVEDVASLGESPLRAFALLEVKG
jgi:hypothetical protein